MLSDALAYANVALGGAVCICVSNLLGNAVRGTGNMSFPAAVLVGCVVVHIAISPVLIFGLGPLPALGPAGAGWGLVIPFAGGSAVMIWYLRSRAIVRLNFHGVTPRWELFADILKVGVPGLINIAITNLSVVVLTGIAGQMGRDTALGYAMGARLEYIQQPVAFGFGTAIVAMVGTNWGAKPSAPIRPVLKPQQWKFQRSAHPRDRRRADPCDLAGATKLQIGRAHYTVAAADKFGAAHRKQLLRTKPLHLQLKPSPIAVANGEVDILAREIDTRVSCRHPEIDLRMCLGEAPEAIDEPLCGKVQ
jgi:hypothetical protein